MVIRMGLNEPPSEINHPDVRDDVPSCKWLPWREKGGRGERV